MTAPRSRTVGVSALLAAAALAAAAVALTYGDYPLTLPEVAAALVPGSEGFEHTVVVAWRLPAAVAAVLFGALLGAGGAVFQSLTRNPLGSPDVIGFDAGAQTAVVVVILVVGAGQVWSVSAAALLGGAATALLVLALAYRRGVEGFRLIVVGIGVSAFLGSINAYLVTRADIDQAMSVGFWSAGSLGKVGWPNLIPVMVGALVVAVVLTIWGPALRQMELGEDTAASHGVRIARSRVVLILVGVTATALVTAAAGPIAFVALAAPQIARRLTAAPGVAVLPAACAGAAVLAVAHLVSQASGQFFRPIPVGLLTVCFGGMYLIVLLIRETRRMNVVR